MHFDSGRLADLKHLEAKVKAATSQRERSKYLNIIGNLQRQAEDPKLNKERELLMEARRQGDKAGDKLEEKINREYNH